MVKVKIERYSDQLEGIGHLDGKVIFVPKTIVGEIVDVTITEEKSNYFRGKIKEIKNIVDCPVFFDCGGCSLRRFDYTEGLNLKKEAVLKLFKKNEIEIPKLNLIKNNNPFNYRNKISLKIVNKKIGFYTEKTNSLIEVSNCLITKEEINKFLSEIPKFKINNGEMITYNTTTKITAPIVSLIAIISGKNNIIENIIPMVKRTFPDFITLFLSLFILIFSTFIHTNYSIYYFRY